MANDAPPGLPCPLCFVLGHLRRLFRATNIPVVIDEAEENSHDDIHQGRCRRDHPSSLFSAKQRQEEPNKRICIGREGHIRLCEHRTFGWDEFVHTSSTTNADTSITCNHPDHLGASKKPEVDYHREDRWSGDGTAYIHTEFSGCSEHDGCVILSHNRSIRRRMSTAQALEPCDSQWYQALDPSSHNLVEDIEFKNVTWCEDARCRNFYRFRDHASVGTSTS
ncbi:hypothetical protein CABS01_09346 [Colletotrichum abscissum]|uniref:uncharacterized protein n=1 Tax=Colletotrichum abscissum TaxID=1671311 RepID=UPI0027D64E77|nr:uncharacterized protein CABS01_09346 [Colletotrichum abscissum]KAK1502735.1 hypothetical protein CABS01_09346 [Colletotrichum abscissum]